MRDQQSSVNVHSELVGDSNNGHNSDSAMTELSGAGTESDSQSESEKNENEDLQETNHKHGSDHDHDLSHDHYLEHESSLAGPGFSHRSLSSAPTLHESEDMDSFMSEHSQSAKLSLDLDSAEFRPDLRSTGVQHQPAWLQREHSTLADIDSIKYDITSKKLPRSKNIKSSKSSSIKRKKQTQKSSKFGLHAYNFALFALHLLSLFLKALRSLFIRIYSTSFIQKTVFPFLDRFLIALLLEKRNNIIKFASQTAIRVRNLSLSDIILKVRELCMWIIAMYTYCRNFDYQYYFTPIPQKMPESPKKPVKQFNEVWSKFVCDMQAQINALKVSQAYIWFSRNLDFLLSFFFHLLTLFWSITAPLRTSRFGKAVVYFVLTCAQFAITAINAGLKTPFVIKTKANFVKTFPTIWRIFVKLMLSVTPLAIVAYSMQVSSGKEKLNILAFDTYAQLPYQYAEEIEAKIGRTLKMHAVFYVFLTTSFTCVTAWIYIPLFKNLAKKEMKSILSPVQSNTQKAVTLAIFALTLANAAEFQASSLSITNTISMVQNLPTWTILNATLSEIPILSKTKSPPVISSYSSGSPLQNACPLEIIHDTKTDTGAVVCLRNTESKPVSLSFVKFCKCPVQEIASCALTKQLKVPQLPKTRNTIQWTVSLSCSNEHFLLPLVHSSKNDVENRQYAPSFDESWIPAPTTYFHTRPHQAPQLDPTPVHIGVRYSSITVSFSEPVVGPISVSSSANTAHFLMQNTQNLPLFNVTATRVSRSGAVQSLLLPITIHAVASTSPLKLLTTFQIKVNTTLLFAATNDDDVSIVVVVAPGTCFSRLTGVACDSGATVVVTVPRITIPWIVALGEVASVGSAADNGIYELKVVFDAAVGAGLRKSGGDVLRSLAVDDFSLEYERLGNGINDRKILDILAVKEDDEYAGGKFRAYKLSFAISDNLATVGFEEVGRLIADVSDSVVGREWPRLKATTTKQYMDVLRGVCCGIKAKIPALHPSQCNTTVKFITGPICPVFRPPKAIQVQVLPAVDSSTRPFLGFYASKENHMMKLSFTKGLSCARDYKLETIFRPPLNISAPTSGIYTVGQTCIHESALGLKQTADPLTSITRFVHIKESPPQLHIISAFRDSQHKNRLHLVFNFTSPLKNSTVPVSSVLNMTLYRGEKFKTSLKIFQLDFIEDEKPFNKPSFEWNIILQSPIEMLKGDRVHIFLKEEVSSGNEWACTDATPPYGACLQTPATGVVITESATIALVQFGGSVDDDSVFVRIQFTTPVFPRSGAWSVDDFVITVRNVNGVKIGLRNIRVINLVDVGVTNAIGIVVDMSESELMAMKGLAELYVNLVRRRFVARVEQNDGDFGKSYLSEKVFSISVNSCKSILFTSLFYVI
ncbi:hypothetical protein HK100_011307 [Physocladia obscura]|uniref:Uncharacterized protein n=1 Tax=Physocladia obscura TaxID=109957 RepID=A0AAD5XDB3_9FUNG|nr:hypothetical protein HK100_011307 [Physocladia obscura]